MTESPHAEALILVDVQRVFVTGSQAVPGAQQLRSAIDTLLTCARAAGRLIVHVQNDGPKGSADEAGTSGWQLVVTPRGGELVIRKTNDDAFVDTNLEDKLRQHGVSRLAIGGVQSEMCVAATARAAQARGLVVVLPHDAHATYPIPEHDGYPAVPAHYVSRSRNGLWVTNWSWSGPPTKSGSIDKGRVLHPLLHAERLSTQPKAFAAQTGCLPSSLPARPRGITSRACEPSSTP